LGPVENGLAGDKALSRQGKRRRGRFLFGKCGFHHYYIGVSLPNFRRMKRGVTPRWRPLV